MQILPGESLSISELIAKKQDDGARKIEILRGLSDEERKALNERSAAECLRISAEFGKSRRFEFGGKV
ncbi:hypothetical protein J2Y86_000920 [Pseudomonas migulae]|uniref:hypothetical protein n=1 Tax=Pseudomonas migulae TaxID=78543 RepID=UPI00209CA570|nr:hypothetical protein [Pseudomonas migulae]MCP1496213.1 hypothetical protein [Pseudomonas migulae]